MFPSLARRMRALAIEDDGPTATEYAILLALMVVALVVTLRVLGLSTRGLFGQLWSSINPPDDALVARNGVGRF